MRIAFTLAIGVLAGLLTIWFQRDHVSDLAQPWGAARTWRAGLNPYDAVGPEPWRAFHSSYRLIYPFTAVLLTVPLSALPLWLAEGVLVGLGTITLAWALTRTPRDARLWVFASAAFLAVPQMVQWSPLLTASALMPSLGFVMLAKPQIGLPLLLAYPSRRAVIGCAALALLSFAIWPGWIWPWLDALRTDAGHITAPMRLPGGFLLALAALKWRRPEARLLLAMSVIPHNHSRYEIVPLFLIVHTWREGVALTLCTIVEYAIVLGLFLSGTSLERVEALSGTLILWCVYLPCLALILRRPNAEPARITITGWVTGRHEGTFESPLVIDPGDRVAFSLDPPSARVNGELHQAD